MGGSASKSGSRCNTRDNTSATSSPVNARCPVSISNSTQPKAHMSARRSTVRPFACSGLMYAAVPRIIPACVIAGVVIVGDIEHARQTNHAAGSMALARPKSSTFTVPSDRTLMFAGFRSRWMMPLLVRGFERLRDLLRDGQRLVDRNGAAGDTVRERRRPRLVPSRGRWCRRDFSSPWMCAMFG